MITINLRPGQKRKGGGSSLAGLTTSFRGLTTKIREPMLLLAMLVVGVVVLGLLWVGIGVAAERRSLQPQLESTRQEARRFRNIVAQKRREELIRDSLVSQIEVIRTVDGDRYVWPHLLDEVARALPPYTWLVNVQTLQVSAALVDSIDAALMPQDVEFQIDGRTVDIQAYTRFLRQLEASPWVRNVTPISARTVVESDRPVTAFAIRATFNRADSAYVRTVPLSQSVR